MRIKDLSGQKFGRLTVIEIDLEKTKSKPNAATHWRCKCQCGIEKTVRSDHLTQGRIKSCGCLEIEARHWSRGLEHGMSHTKFHCVWTAMKNRCKDKTFKYYGGRGISVCDRWQDFNNFYDDMYTTYKPGLTIDRKDVNGNYEPDNCRWATRKEQQRNLRSNHREMYRGECLTLAELAEKYNVKGSQLYKRLNAGWSIEEAIEIPPLSPSQCKTRIIGYFKAP